MIPHRTPAILPILYPSLTWRVKAREKVVYLTFDDGPVPGPTEFVLDQLAAFSIRATFFCIGDNIRKHPHIFRRIISDGHIVGNHTVNHVNGWKLKNPDYIENVRAFEEIAMNAGMSQAADLFRPPYGCVTRKQIRDLHNYRIIMWDVLSQDYDHRLPPEKCLDRTLKACREGSIIVFHDSYKAQRNMQFTLPRLIAALRERASRFDAL
jgi:peptidoglycan-N-acetylglucosamine deacetylase